MVQLSNLHTYLSIGIDTKVHPNIRLESNRPQNMLGKLFNGNIMDHRRTFEFILMFSPGWF